MGSNCCKGDAGGRPLRSNSSIYSRYFLLAITILQEFIGVPWVLRPLRPSRAGASLDERFKAADDAAGVRLTVTSASTGDTNVYTLQASNAAGSDTSRVRLEVCADEAPTGDDPPTFLRRLQDLTVKVGTRTRFLVEIVSSTECKVTWFRNERRLLEAERVALARDGNFWCADVAAVSVDDAGRWTCTAENAGGRASCSAHLNVLVPKAYKRPEFMEELRALLTEQGTVSLECKVVGVPTPVLRWFKDSQEIKAGDVFALTANAEDPTSLGTYTCEAVNCMGRAYSSSKVHVVGRGSREGSARPTSSSVTPEPPPIFTKELEDHFVRICEPLTLGCHIVVPPWPRSVVWYNKEGKIEPSERYHVLEDGAGGYLLEVPSAEWPDEGEWKCVATSTGGRVGISTCYVTMDVPKNYRKPRFMENLQAVLTEEGLVSFECKVVGFPTPVLSWFKDGQELKPGDVYQLTGTNSLGSYCCIARNCMGQASSSAELTVEDIQNQLNEEEKLQLFSKNQAPKFIQGLKSVEAKIDEPFRFTVKVAIPPEPSVLWYRDDQPVDESSRCHHGREDRGVFYLDIQSLEFLDQAEWKCVAMNDFGHSVTSCFLKLIIPRHYKKPRFLENLQAILSDEGAVNLECKVIGVPQPVLKWYKDGEELKPGDIHRIISGQDGTCCLGTYTCEAQNCMGIAASSASLLGFDDSMKAKNKKAEEQALQRNLSLSTIHEERTSQMYDTPVGDVTTLDDKGEISFSFDGKEVSVSLYETPDLTEEEALQIVEMYADQLSENITEHNVVELPPLRFVKETSTSGNLLMEAVIIDVSPEYFVSPDEDMRTEADIEDISIADENGPPQLSLDQDIEIGGEDYLEKTMAMLSEEKSDISFKLGRKKSDSQKSADDFYSLSRDQSLSEEKRDDDTQAISDLQSFASAHSLEKPKSKLSKPSGEDGQESSEPTKTILYKEEALKHSLEAKPLPVVKPKRERRTSRSSRRSSSGSEKSVTKAKDEVLRKKESFEMDMPKKSEITDEEFKDQITNISNSLSKVINDAQIIERDIILKSELMSSAATASRSLEIISSLISPLSEIHSIADAAKESDSKEVSSTLFNSLPQPLKALQQSLTIIEKCIDMESDTKTLVKKTCVAFIETCGSEMQKLISDINSITSKDYLLTEDRVLTEIESLNNEMSTVIKFSVDTIKARNLLSEASEIKVDEPSAEVKHVRDTQKAVFELKNPVMSLLSIAESADSGKIIDVVKVRNSEVILNDMSGSIQDLQTALEQIETLSVKESNMSLHKYNTEIIETVMESVVKLRSSFEQLSRESEGNAKDILKQAVASIKENLNKISSQIQVFEKNVGDFDVLQSENKLDALQKMAQILIALENNLPRLDLLPAVKNHMTVFHKNLTKILENVIESNESKKYFTLMEICDAINRINASIKNLDVDNVLPLASLNNTLRIIQDQFITNIFDSELNCSLLTNIADILVGIQEAINTAEEVSIQIDSEHIKEMVSQGYDETKAKIVVEHIEHAIAAIEKVKTLESTQYLRISIAPSIENICPVLEELKRSVASIKASGVEEEHISDLSEVSSFAQTLATPLCELNHNIIVLNQTIVENIESLKENSEVMATIAEPLHELHTTLEILQQDVLSQYGEDLTSYDVSITMASAVQNLQSCIVMIQEQNRMEAADEMSTLEDISGIKTTADTLPSDRLILPTAEETAIEQAILPFDQELQITATAQALQTLNEHITVLQSPDIIDALDSLSEVSDYSSLKSFVIGLGELHSGIEEVLHPLLIEGSNEIGELINPSKLTAIAEPMQELQQSLSVLDISNIPIYENLLEMPAERIHSVIQTVSEFKEHLDKCMLAVFPALHTTDKTVEIANKVGTLREVCEHLKDIFETTKTVGYDSVPEEVKALEHTIDKLLDATDVSKGIKIEQVKSITEELYQKVATVQEELIQFTPHAPEKLAQEAKLIQTIDEVQSNIAVLEQYDFVDLSRVSDLTCTSPQMAIEIESDSLMLMEDIVDSAVNVVQDSTQDMPIADLMIVEDFFKTCKNEFMILRYLISKAATHKKIIRLLQEFSSLQSTINDFKTKRLELSLSDDINGCLATFLIHAEDCLQNVQISLIKIVDSQAELLIEAPLVKFDNFAKVFKAAKDIKHSDRTIQTVNKFCEILEVAKPFLENVQANILDEIKSARAHVVEGSLFNKFEEFATFVEEVKSQNNDVVTKDILDQVSTCIDKHNDFRDANGTGKTLILLKCLTDCTDILQEHIFKIKVQKRKVEDGPLKAVLTEMLEPLQALHRQLTNVQEQVLNGVDEDSISVDISTTENLVQTMTEKHKEMIERMETEEVIANEEISLIMEVDKEIHSIQDSLRSMESVQVAQVVKEIAKPVENIEKSMHNILSSEKLGIHSEDRLPKDVNSNICSFESAIENFIKIDMDLLVESITPFDADINESFKIAAELKDLLTLNPKELSSKLIKIKYEKIKSLKDVLSKIDWQSTEVYNEKNQLEIENMNSAFLAAYQLLAELDKVDILNKPEVKEEKAKQIIQHIDQYIDLIEIVEEISAIIKIDNIKETMDIAKELRESIAASEIVTEGELTQEKVAEVREEQTRLAYKLQTALSAMLVQVFESAQELAPALSTEVLQRIAKVTAQLQADLVAVTGIRVAVQAPTESLLEIAKTVEAVEGHVASLTATKLSAVASESEATVLDEMGFVEKLSLPEQLLQTSKALEKSVAESEEVVTSENANMMSNEAVIESIYAKTDEIIAIETSEATVLEQTEAASTESILSENVKHIEAVTDQAQEVASVKSLETESISAVMVEDLGPELHELTLNEKRIDVEISQIAELQDTPKATIDLLIQHIDQLISDDITEFIDEISHLINVENLKQSISIAKELRENISASEVELKAETSDVLKDEVKKQQAQLEQQLYTALEAIYTLPSDSFAEITPLNRNTIQRVVEITENLRADLTTITAKQNVIEQVESNAVQLQPSEFEITEATTTTIGLPVHDELQVEIETTGLMKTTLTSPKSTEVEAIQITTKVGKTLADTQDALTSSKEEAIVSDVKAATAEQTLQTSEERADKAITETLLQNLNEFLSDSFVKAAEQISAILNNDEFKESVAIAHKLRESIAKITTATDIGNLKGLLTREQALLAQQLQNSLSPVQILILENPNSIKLSQVIGKDSLEQLFITTAHLSEELGILSEVYVQQELGEGKSEASITESLLKTDETNTLKLLKPTSLSSLQQESTEKEFIETNSIVTPVKIDDTNEITNDVELLNHECSKSEYVEQISLKSEVKETEDLISKYILTDTNKVPCSECLIDEDEAASSYQEKKTIELSPNQVTEDPTQTLVDTGNTTLLHEQTLNENPLQLIAETNVSTVVQPKVTQTAQHLHHQTVEGKENYAVATDETMKSLENNELFSEQLAECAIETSVIVTDEKVQSALGVDTNQVENQKQSCNDLATKNKEIIANDNDTTIITNETTESRKPNKIVSTEELISNNTAIGVGNPSKETILLDCSEMETELMIAEEVNKTSLGDAKLSTSDVLEVATTSVAQLGEEIDETTIAGKVKTPSEREPDIVNDSDSQYNEIVTDALVDKHIILETSTVATINQVYAEEQADPIQEFTRDKKQTEIIVTEEDLMSSQSIDQLFINSSDNSIVSAEETTSLVDEPLELVNATIKKMVAESHVTNNVILKKENEPVKQEQVGHEIIIEEQNYFENIATTAFVAIEKVTSTEQDRYVGNADNSSINQGDIQSVDATAVKFYDEKVEENTEITATASVTETTSHFICELTSKPLESENEVGDITVTVEPFNSVQTTTNTNEEKEEHLELGCLVYKEAQESHLDNVEVVSAITENSEVIEPQSLTKTQSTVSIEDTRVSDVSAIASDGLTLPSKTASELPTPSKIFLEQGLIGHIDDFISDAISTLVNEISVLTNSEELKESFELARVLKESLKFSAMTEELNLFEEVKMEQVKVIGKLQEALSNLHTKVLEKAEDIAPIAKPDVLQKVSEIITHLQEDLETAVVFGLPHVLKAAEIVEIPETEENSMKQLKVLLQEVTDKINVPTERDVEDTEALRDTLDEVQTVIIKLKRDYDGAANDTLNETLEDLECSVRSVQLQINEDSPPELLKEACATLQLLVNNMSETQEVRVAETTAVEVKNENILEKCSTETDVTLKLLELASETNIKYSNLAGIVSSLKILTDTIKTLKLSFMSNADVLIEKGVDVVQSLDQLEEKVFMLEKDLADVTIPSETSDHILTAVHSVYGSISNMRGTILSIQKRYMFENYGKPSETLLRAIKNISAILDNDDAEIQNWKAFSKSLRKLLNHFEDIKFYINLDKTARLPSDAAFTKIILEELKSNICEIILPQTSILGTESNEKVNNLLDCVNKSLANIESKSMLEVKEKIPVFKVLSSQIYDVTDFIRTKMYEFTKKTKQEAIQNETDILKHQNTLNIDQVFTPEPVSLDTKTIESLNTAMSLQENLALLEKNDVSNKIIDKSAQTIGHSKEEETMLEAPSTSEFVKEEASDRKNKIRKQVQIQEVEIESDIEKIASEIIDEIATKAIGIVQNLEESDVLEQAALFAKTTSKSGELQEAKISQILQNDIEESLMTTDGFKLQEKISEKDNGSEIILAGSSQTADEKSEPNHQIEDKKKSDAETVSVEAMLLEQKPIEEEALKVHDMDVTQAVTEEKTTEVSELSKGMIKEVNNSIVEEEKQKKITKKKDEQFNQGKKQPEEVNEQARELDDTHDKGESSSKAKAKQSEEIFIEDGLIKEIEKVNLVKEQEDEHLNIKTKMIDEHHHGEVVNKTQTTDEAELEKTSLEDTKIDKKQIKGNDTTQNETVSTDLHDKQTEEELFKKQEMLLPKNKVEDLEKECHETEILEREKEETCLQNADEQNSEKFANEDLYTITDENTKKIIEEIKILVPTEEELNLTEENVSKKKEPSKSNDTIIAEQISTEEIMVMKEVESPKQGKEKEHEQIEKHLKNEENADEFKQNDKVMQDEEIRSEQIESQIKQGKKEPYQYLKEKDEKPKEYEIVEKAQNTETNVAKIDTKIEDEDSQFQKDALAETAKNDKIIIEEKRVIEENTGVDKKAETAKKIKVVTDNAIEIKQKEIEKSESDNIEDRAKLSENEKKNKKEKETEGGEKRNIYKKEIEEEEQKANLEAESDFIGEADKVAKEQLETKNKQLKIEEQDNMLKENIEKETLQKEKEEKAKQEDEIKLIKEAKKLEEVQLEAESKRLKIEEQDKNEKQTIAKNNVQKEQAEGKLKIEEDECVILKTENKLNKEAENIATERNETEMKQTEQDENNKLESEREPKEEAEQFEKERVEEQNVKEKTAKFKPENNLQLEKENFEADNKRLENKEHKKEEACSTKEMQEKQCIQNLQKEGIDSVTKNAEEPPLNAIDDIKKGEAYKSKNIKGKNDNDYQKQEKDMEAAGEKRKYEDEAIATKQKDNTENQEKDESATGKKFQQKEEANAEKQKDEEKQENEKKAAEKIRKREEEAIATKQKEEAEKQENDKKAAETIRQLEKEATATKQKEDEKQENDKKEAVKKRKQEEEAIAAKQKEEFEKQENDKKEAEKNRQQEEEAIAKKQKEEAVKQENDKKAAEKIRKQEEEAKAKKQKEEDEKKENDKKAAKKKRQQEEEAIAKKQKEDEKQENDKKEAERKRKQEEEAIAKKQKEDEKQENDKKEAEKKRKQEEEAIAAKQKEEVEKQENDKKEAEKKRQQEEEAKAKKQKEDQKQETDKKAAEKQRKQEEEAIAAKQKEETEKQENDKKAAEKKRQQEAAEAKKQKEDEKQENDKKDAEKKRQQEEEAIAKKQKEDEKQENDKKEAEKKRKQEEEAIAAKQKEEAEKQENDKKAAEKQRQQEEEAKAKKQKEDQKQETDKKAAEKQRKQDEEAIAAKQKEETEKQENDKKAAEKKRQQEAAEAKKQKEDEKQENDNKDAEKKRQQEEEAKAKKQKEDKKQETDEKAAEKKRKQEEEAIATKQREDAEKQENDKKAAKKKRQQEEEAIVKKQKDEKQEKDKKEAEKKRKQEEEAIAKKQKEEAEKQENDKKAAEKQRQQEEEAKAKKQKEDQKQETDKKDTEKKRQQEEEAKAKKLKEDEKQETHQKAAENKRKEEEDATATKQREDAEKQENDKKAAEKKRQQEEKAKAQKQKEDEKQENDKKAAEKIRKQEEEAIATKQKEEAEKQENDKKAAEKKRQQEAAEAKKQKEDEKQEKDKRRQQEEEVMAKKQTEVAEKKQKDDEKQVKDKKAAEKKHKQEEIEATKHKEDAEKQENDKKVAEKKRKQGEEAINTKQKEDDEKLKKELQKAKEREEILKLERANKLEKERQEEKLLEEEEKARHEKRRIIKKKREEEESRVKMEAEETEKARKDAAQEKKIIEKARLLKQQEQVEERDREVRETEKRMREERRRVIENDLIETKKKPNVAVEKDTLAESRFRKEANGDSAIQTDEGDHYIREYQYEPKRGKSDDRSKFVDRNHRDYTMEFLRPSGYRERGFEHEKYSERQSLGQNATIYKAQTIILDSQLRSSAPPQPERSESEQRTDRYDRGDSERRVERHRSKAFSEARSMISEKRSGLSRDIKRKPVFSTYLTDRTAVEGSRVKLTCSVLSSSDPKITWYKNGVLLDDKLKYRTKFIDGLITLEVLNAVVSDSAEYCCTVENENGSVNTSANLKVYPSFEASPIPPTFTRSIRDTYHLAENELVLECRIRGQPLPKITWLKDDKPVSSNERYQAFYLADGVCRLAISSPTPEDSGKYTCKAENSVWSDQITHIVSFTGKESSLSQNITTIERTRFNRQALESRRPHFTNVLSDYKVAKGGTIGLQVEIRGCPTRVEWLREGRNVTEVYRNAKTFVEQGLYTLALSDVTEKESGMYTCRAWSSHGNVDMNAAITVVQPNELDGKPAIIVGRPEKDILISVGEDVNISFRVQGEPKPKVVFMKGIRDITTNQRVCKMTSDDYVKFTLKRSGVSDAGTYCILARNAYGCDRAFVTVVVRQRASSENLISDWTYPMDDSALSIAERKYKTVPDRIPGEPSVVDGGNNWVSLAWPKTDPRDTAPVLAYKIESWLIGKEGGARWVELGITPLNSFDAFNLKQGEEYHFRVTPRNRYGWGESVATSTPIGIGLAGDRPEFVEILPGQLKVLAGETANLSCSVKGKPVPEIFWMKNGHEIEEESRMTTLYNGQDCSLTIKDICIEDEARYSCEASNVHGRASTYARLAVVTDRLVWEADAKLKRERSQDAEGDYPPQFTMRLRDRRVQATYPVRLTCQVVGNPPPTLTWFKDGEQLVFDSRRNKYQDEHFHTLEIAPTSLEDGGVYEAMARNSSGAVSCRCSLVVDKGIRAYVAPEFCCGLEPLYRLSEGEELRISAVVEAYPSVGVTWYRDGVRLRPSRRAIMTLDRDGQIELALAAVTARDAGVYTCTASNEVGRASTSGKVDIVGGKEPREKRTPPVLINAPDIPYSKEPMFVRKPRSSEAREGDTVIIACEVIGDPKPDVYWLRDFLKPDYYRDASHFKRVGDGPEYRFEIPHAKLDYTGAYSVVARNVHGEAKAIISLQILAKDPSSTDDSHNVRYGRVEVIPRFDRELTDLLSYDGDAVEFECHVSGNPEPDIRWFHYNELIRDCPDFESSFDEGAARLKIKQVTAEDEGTYSCEASNNLGKATSSACLVVYPPGEPNTLSQRLRRPPALLSAASTPRSTPRSTPARSVSRTPGPDSRRLCSPSRQMAPSFYTYPFNKVVEEGDHVTFKCAVKGQPAPWATWDKDGIIITPSARFTIKEKDELLRILEIEQVSIEDVGIYRITVENEFGRAEASARLEVITQKGKFYGGVRAYSASPRKSLTYRRYPSVPRQD